MIHHSSNLSPWLSSPGTRTATRRGVTARLVQGKCMAVPSCHRGPTSPRELGNTAPATNMDVVVDVHVHIYLYKYLSIYNTCIYIVVICCHMLHYVAMTPTDIQQIYSPMGWFQRYLWIEAVMNFVSSCCRYRGISKKSSSQFIIRFLA